MKWELYVNCGGIVGFIGSRFLLCFLLKQYLRYKFYLLNTAVAILQSTYIDNKEMAELIIYNLAI